MRRILFFIAILIFPMFASRLLAQASDAGNAVEGYKLVCDEPVFNFGTVGQSAVITNVFVIRNVGDLTYVHKYVHTSCGCTRGRLDKRMVGPGETAKLTAVYKAIRRKGTQKKSLKLIPIDSNTPVLTFYMEGFVEPSADSR